MLICTVTSSTYCFRFRPIDDIGVRVASGHRFEDSYKQRYTRFTLWPDVNPLSARRFDQIDNLATGTYLDKLMGEIPGKSN